MNSVPLNSSKYVWLLASTYREWLSWKRRAIIYPKAWQKLAGKPIQSQQNPKSPFTNLTLNLRGVSSIMAKFEMAKYIHLEMGNFFVICHYGYLFCHLYTLHVGFCIEKILRGKHEGVQVCKKFLYIKCKNKSHLKMDIFCHFKFFHNRKNGFWECVS